MQTDRIVSVLLFISILAFCANPSYGQEPGHPAISLFGELAGNTALLSLNADILFSSGFGLRVGGFFDPEGFDESDTHVMLGTVNYLIGRGKDKLELGLGVIFGDDPEMLLDEMGIGLPSPTATIGYRLQPGYRDVVFRVGFTPIVSRGRFIPRAGISIGWQLPKS